MTVEVHDAKVLRALRELRNTRYPGICADALNATAFEIREAEGAQVAKVFEFKGSSTKNFLASPKSFLFNKATERNLSVRIFPRDKANSLLLIHEDGGTVSAPDERTLKVGTRIAIPVGIKPNARGRVPAGQTPGALLAEGGKGFVSKSGNAVLKRSANGSVQVAYALVDSFRDRPRLEFATTAEKTVRAVFPAKAEKAIAKFQIRNGG